MEWLASTAALLGRIAGWLLDQLPPRRYLRVRLDVRFVRAAAPIATIDPGGEVFVFGTRGPQPAEISSSGGCSVLTPINP